MKRALFLVLLLSLTSCAQPQHPNYHTITLWAYDGSVIRRWEGENLSVSVEDNGTLELRDKNTGERVEINGTYTHERTFGRPARIRSAKEWLDSKQGKQTGFAKWKANKIVAEKDKAGLVLTPENEKISRDIYPGAKPGIAATK